jgi:hypothetical protein
MVRTLRRIRSHARGRAVLRSALRRLGWKKTRKVFKGRFSMTNKYRRKRYPK